MSGLDKDLLTADELRAAARSHKKAARERLGELRARLGAALTAKKVRMKELVEECQRERLAVRGAIFAMRQSALEGLRAEIKTARQTARDRREARLVEIRSTSQAAAAAARAALAAHRQHDSEQKRITTHERRRKADLDKVHAQTLAGGALHGAKFEKLRPLFERARTVPVLPGESRMEALWRYAKAHPEEMHAILEPKAEAVIAKTKVELAQVEQSARAPNAFELKRAARAERMRARAEKLRGEAQGAFTRESAIRRMIPLGQPILVGHHSEKRHRRDLRRMDSLMGKGVALSKEAETLERRAAFAEKNTAISSDDPDALPKLRDKLARLEKDHATMRAANAAIRKGGDVVARLVALGFKEARAKQLLEKDHVGRVGFPGYKLTNTAAEEQRLKGRIREFEVRAVAPTRPAEVVGGATIAEAENRVRIRFPAKPPEPIRRALKLAGFRWAPTVDAWQRFASAAAWAEARRVLATLGQAAMSTSAASHATPPTR